MTDAQQVALMLKVLRTLDEAQARWYVAKEALALGRGGLRRMHELTGMSQPTILKGMRELRSRGQPLVSYETVVNLISRTTTRTGLKIAARLDTRAYDPGIKISDAEMARLKVMPHKTHPQWNYTVNPR
jgi:hypothetical protein